MWWKISIYHKNNNLFYIYTNSRRKVSEFVGEEFRNSFVKKIIIEDSGKPELYFDPPLDTVLDSKLVNKPLSKEEHLIVTLIQDNKWYHHTKLNSSIDVMLSLQKRGFVRSNMKNINPDLHPFLTNMSQCFQLTGHAFYYKKQLTL